MFGGVGLEVNAGGYVGWLLGWIDLMIGIIGLSSLKGVSSSGLLIT